MTRCLLEAGADVMKRDNRGNTPLLVLRTTYHRRVDSDNERDLTGEEDDGTNDDSDGVLPIVKLMVAHGGTSIVHCANSSGETALHFYARFVDLLPVLKYLIEECEANVNATNNEGWTPLMRAFWTTTNGMMMPSEVILYLICDAGANVLRQNRDGDTCLTLYLRGHSSPEIFEALCQAALSEAGGRNSSDALEYFKPTLVISGSTSATIMSFVVKNILGDATRFVRNDDNGDTALHAIFRDDFWGNSDFTGLILCLVEEGRVDLLATNHEGLTAAEMAQRVDDTQSAQELIGLHQGKIMKLLHFLNSLDWFPGRVDSQST